MSNIQAAGDAPTTHSRKSHPSKPSRETACSRHASAICCRPCRPATSMLPKGGTFSTLANSCTTARIIMLTPGLQKADVAEAMRFGVRGVVVKGVSAELFFKSIRAVAAGQYWIDREMVGDLAQSLCTASRSGARAVGPKRFGLTGRELQIVSLLIGGGANKDIAIKCGIRERTVKQHLTNVFDKLGVSNRLELALFALQERLVAPLAADCSRAPLPG